MTDEEALIKAVNIASEAFENRIDKAGEPYIVHCRTVMDGVKPYGPKVMTAAVLHDILEDCSEWTEERLFSEGFSDDIVGIIKTLTKPADYDYWKYIEKIAENPVASVIKCSDLRHNMDITRLPCLSEKDIKRIKKYHKAYKFLVDRR